jgi:hypothetical protein
MGLVRMPLDLSGVNSKIGRAYEHLHALDAEVQTWIRGYPYGLRHEIRDEGREHVGFLEIYRAPESARFGLLVGDCTQNLRSALDHLAFAAAADGLAALGLNSKELAKAEGGIQFPISTTEDAWGGALRIGRLKGVRDQVLAEIKRRQPCFASDPPEDDVLFALHWLNNRDKHRILHAVAAFPHVAVIDFIPELPGPSEGHVVAPPYENGTKVFEAKSVERCPDVKVKCNFLLEIRVRETPIAEDIRELLLKIGQLVQRIASDVAKAHDAI